MVTSFALAQDDGGAAGGFLRYGVGGRAMGMGRAFVSISDDASGVYWNPAGIIGAERIELTSMYTDLYYDTQYGHLGFIYPRPGKNLKDRVARFLVGPYSSIGFGWVGLFMSGFEQRTATREYIGDFGIGENGFLFAWAREEIGSWGIFRYGFSLKFVNQNFTGLSSEDGEFDGARRDWSGGMDFGIIFQPINAPIFRIFSLKYLLPLRLGIVAQNIIQPSWSVNGVQKDIFPRVVRYGVSYRLVLRDWIPESWRFVRSMVGSSQILLSCDREYTKNTRSATYYGAEGIFRISRSGFAVFSRAGYNDKSREVSFGFGISMPFASTALVRIDYAYNLHPYLPEDNRFFLTVKMGRRMDADYFIKNSRRTDQSRRERRKNLLSVISRYPNDHLLEAVEMLAETEDSILTRRYYKLTGGLGLARSLFRESKNLLIQGKINKARKKALKAAEEYAGIFYSIENPLSEEDVLNYGEALIIAQQPEDALSVIEEVQEQSLRYYYLLAICKRAVGDWDGALSMFQNAVKRYESEQDEKSMVCLSFLGLGEALIMKSQFDSAITTFNVILKNYSGRLDSDYPRYPTIADGYVLDDAQLLKGICYIKMEKYMEGISELLKTYRFYPGLDYGVFIEEAAEDVIAKFKSSDFDGLMSLIQGFFDHYINEHMWPPVKERR